MEKEYPSETCKVNHLKKLAPPGTYEFFNNKLSDVFIREGWPDTFHVNVELEKDCKIGGSCVEISIERRVDNKSNPFSSKLSEFRAHITKDNQIVQISHSVQLPYGRVWRDPHPELRIPGMIRAIDRLLSDPEAK